MKLKKENGLTLIELMIVVAIIAIIGSIAFPAYQQYAIEARRTDAKNMLLQLAGLQERFYAENGFYAQLATISSGATVDTDQGFYNVAADCSPDSATCAAASRPQFFTLTATRQAGQAEDTKCGDYTYDQSGTQGITNNAAGVTPADCW